MNSGFSKEYDTKGNKLLIPSPRSSPTLVEGRGLYVKDIEGKEYMDFFAGAGSIGLGHNHPEVVEAIRTQLGKLTGNSFLNYNVPLIELAERISKIVPKPLEKSLLLNSGTEAVERAIQIAQKYALAAGKRGNGIISLTHSYHGQYGIASALTGLESSMSKAGMAIPPGIIHTPAPYCYRCPQQSVSQCCHYSTDVIEEMIRCSIPISTIIYEPILGVGGVIVPPNEYHEQVQRIRKEFDITLILDEIFTGLGRTGKILALEHWNLVPDILCIGKILGGIGMPIGAVVVSEEVANALKAPDYIATFGGNPVCCAAASTTIDVILRQKLHENAAKVGEFMMKALRDMMKQHKIIGDVRGRGLLIGVEIVKDREKKTPGAKEAKEVRSEALKRGIMFSITGLYGCTIRLTPPLILNEEDATKFLETFEQSLAAVEQAS